MRVPRPPRVPRWPAGPEIGWMMTLGHYMPHVFGTASAVQVAYDAAGQPRALHWAASLVWFAAIGALAAEYMQHREHLCERCASAAPLDPQKTVARWRRFLRLAHADGLWVAWFLATAVIWAEPYIGGPHAVRYSIDAAATCLLVLFLVSVWKHHHLQPWCPWCNWGKGGDKEAVPDPDPDPDPAVSP